MAARDYAKPPKGASRKRRELYKRMPWPDPVEEANEPYHRPTSLAMFEDIDVGRGRARRVSKVFEHDW